VKDYVAVVSRTIKPGCEAAFEAAMREFAAICSAWPGHQELRFLKDNSNPGAYTVVTSYVDEASRRAFTSSPVYQEWMERLAPLSDGPLKIVEHHGLAGFFPTPGSAGPPRWKMALVTFAGVWPLSTLVGRWVRPLFPAAVQGAATSALIVVCLTWFVLPFLTRAARPWLFPASKGSNAHA
jgi:uncharacterized protein